MIEQGLTPRKPSTLERLTIEIAELRGKAKLDSWNAYVTELQVPGDLYPALLTNRPELMATVPRRPLNEHECDVLYKLIGGLLETNAALREHTARVAQLTENLASQMTGFMAVARQVEMFANFRNPEHEEFEE